MANDLIVKSNTLINASHSLSLAEQRLIGLAIIKAREIKMPLTDKVMLEVRASDYVEMFGVDKATAYQILRDASERLFDRHFEYEMFILANLNNNRPAEVTNLPPKAMSDGDDNARIKGRWVEKVGYGQNEGGVYIQFASDIIPFITDLKAYFTKYYLSQTVEFTSSYANRLFEIVMQWQGTGKTPTISLEELRCRLGVEEGQYSDMHNFKKRVLDIAVEQVSRGEYLVTYEQHKKGRKIIGFSFSFKPSKTKGKANRRDPNTIDWVSGQTDNEGGSIHSWQTKGLSDAQIKKIAFNLREFVDANNSKVSSSERRDYSAVFDSWKVLLKDPKTVNTFNMVQELLSRQK